jgi:rod shape-determining protein MreD
VRWVVVAILAYGCLVIEAAVFRPGGLGLEIQKHAVRPDLVLVLGIFLALSLEPYEVFIVGWCLGMASDLVSPYERLGIGAILFSLALYLASYLQGSLFRTRVLTQFLATLAVVFVVHWVWDLAARFAPGAALYAGAAAAGAAFDAIYSAILAPYLFWLFFRLRGPLRLPPGTTLEA